MIEMATYEAAHDYLRDLEQLRRSQEAVIKKINNIHCRLNETSPEKAERYGQDTWSKLRLLYTNAKQFADDEDRVAAALIAQIDTFIATGQSTSHRKKSEGGDKNRKRIKAEADNSRLSSPSMNLRYTTGSEFILVGDQVAARVSPGDADKDEWIEVKVIRFDRESNRLEVIDEEPGDEEESDQRNITSSGFQIGKKYILPSACIIPFPKRSDPASAPDFPAGSQVLAVYPGTTALYKATVASHRKRKTDEYYILEFDDDEEEGMEGLPRRSVPFYQVVPLPEGHRQ